MTFWPAIAFGLGTLLMGVGVAMLWVPIIKSFFAFGTSRNKRRRELQSWARSKGLTFRDGPDWLIAEHFQCLNPGNPFNYGRCAHNIMEGNLSGRAACAFDYSPEEEHGPERSAVIVRTGLQFQPLLIRPEGSLDKAVGFAGHEGVKFESTDFSRQFYVSAADPRWAVEVLPQAALEFLLQSPRFCLEFLGSEVLVYHREKMLSPVDFETAVSVVAGVLDRLPHSVTDNGRVGSPAAIATAATGAVQPADPTHPISPIADTGRNRPDVSRETAPAHGFSGIRLGHIRVVCLILSGLLIVSGVYSSEYRDSTLVIVELVLTAVLLPTLWGLYLYNALVRGRNTCYLSWVDVDVELKRRYDLIPRLVDVVKGYVAHEKEVLESVIRARNAAVASRGSAASQARDENVLVGKIRQLLVVVEGYPELKSSQQFLRLQEELANTENRIQSARRFYNNSVRAYNNRVKTFPSILIAKPLGFKEQDFFEIESAAERKAPTTGVESVLT